MFEAQVGEVGGHATGHRKGDLCILGKWKSRKVLEVFPAGKVTVPTNSLTDHPGVPDTSAVVCMNGMPDQAKYLAVSVATVYCWQSG